MTATELQAGDAVEFDVAAGRVTGKQWGRVGAPLIVCVPGLSQDERSYDVLAPALAADGHCVVALAPRGRGHSPATGDGTYGWPAHARDVAAVADALGAEHFDYVGWSFGAFVGMQLVADAPGRVRRLALLDALGRPDQSALGPITAGLERLGAVYATPEEYLRVTTAGGGMAGCTPAWETYLADDLVAVDGGFATRTDKAAVIEDAVHGGSRDPYDLWPHLTMPVLVVRAARPILPDLGFIVTKADGLRFATTHPDARVVDVDANHYCIGLVPATAALLEEFFHA